MGKSHDSTLRIITICSACLIVSACASDHYKELNTATSEPVVINPAMDNKIVLDNLETGLVATLVIDGDHISVTELQIKMIPRIIKPRSQGELITIKGLSNGNSVTEIQIPDSRLNVEENKGIVILDKRTVSFASPMPQFIDELVITIPSTGKTKRVSISDQLYKQCQKHKNLQACTREKTQPRIK